MKYTLSIIGVLVILFFSACRKISEQSGDCGTDPRCTAMLYGLWEEDKTIFARNFFRLEFNEDGTYREHFTSDGWDNSYVVQDSCVFYVKNKVVNVEHMNGGGTYRTDSINALNREKLELDGEEYKRIN